MWLCDDEVDSSATSLDLGEGAKPPGYYVRRAAGLFPAPLPQDSAAADRAVQHFWFLGVFLAKVLQDIRLVDLPLSHAFLKLLCQGEVVNNINERYCVLSSILRANNNKVLKNKITGFYILQVILFNFIYSPK